MTNTAKPQQSKPASSRARANRAASTSAKSDRPTATDAVKPSALENVSAGAEPALSKLDQMAALLHRDEGATLADLCAATGWQVHSVRGAIAGALKRRGHLIVSDKVDGSRRYRVGRAS